MDINTIIRLSEKELLRQGITYEQFLELSREEQEKVLYKFPSTLRDELRAKALWGQFPVTKYRREGFTEFWRLGRASLVIILIITMVLVATGAFGKVALNK